MPSSGAASPRPRPVAHWGRFGEVNEDRPGRQAARGVPSPDRLSPNARSRIAAVTRRIGIPLVAAAAVASVVVIVLLTTGSGHPRGGATVPADEATAATPGSAARFTYLAAQH